MINVFQIISKYSDKNQFEGWFSVFGSSGEIIQTIFTTIFSIAAISTLLLGVFYGIKAGLKLARSESSAERAEAKSRLLWIIIGCSIALLATLIPTILWNTIGKFSIVNI